MNETPPPPFEEKRDLFHAWVYDLVYGGQRSHHSRIHDVENKIIDLYFQFEKRDLAKETSDEAMRLAKERMDAIWHSVFGNGKGGLVHLDLLSKDDLLKMFSAINLDISVLKDGVQDLNEAKKDTWGFAKQVLTVATSVLVTMFVQWIFR